MVPEPSTSTRSPGRDCARRGRRAASCRRVRPAPPPRGSRARGSRTRSAWASAVCSASAPAHPSRMPTSKRSGQTWWTPARQYSQWPHPSIVSPVTRLPSHPSSAGVADRRRPGRSTRGRGGSGSACAPDRCRPSRPCTARRPYRRCRLARPRRGTRPRPATGSATCCTSARARPGDDERAHQSDAVGSAITRCVCVPSRVMPSVMFSPPFRRDLRGQSPPCPPPAACPC